MNKLLACGLAYAVGSSLFVAPLASAHVLLQSESATSGAVLHITPDDDPIAGQEAGFYFDIRTADNVPLVSSVMTVNGPGDTSTNVETQTTRSGVNASFLAPSQGLYTLSLVTTNQRNQNQRFNYSLRISRGVTDNPLDKPNQSISEFLLVSSLLLIVIIGIFAINRRREIALQSTWK